MRLAVCLAAALALSGCQSVRGAMSSSEPNPGPCPTALSLYDAHRLVEIEGDETTYENVGFTGEILDVASRCRYTASEASPVEMTMAIRFAFGRGPAAEGRERTFDYFVAVTQRDLFVIEKQVFPITVRFDRGEDRVVVTEEFDSISIPRATADTSGTNFEVIVGFELTEEQLEFNRSGLRFRVDAGQDG